MDGASAAAMVEAGPTARKKRQDDRCPASLSPRLDADGRSYERTGFPKGSARLPGRVPYRLAHYKTAAAHEADATGIRQARCAGGSRLGTRTRFGNYQLW